MTISYLADILTLPACFFELMTFTVFVKVLLSLKMKAGIIDPCRHSTIDFYLNPVFFQYFKNFRQTHRKVVAQSLRPKDYFHPMIAGLPRNENNILENLPFFLVSNML